MMLWKFLRAIYAVHKVNAYINRNKNLLDPKTQWKLQVSFRKFSNAFLFGPSGSIIRFSIHPVSPKVFVDRGIIGMDDLTSFERLCFVYLHEIRHVHQYVSGMLKPGVEFSNNTQLITLSWSGKLFGPFRWTNDPIPEGVTWDEYYNWPWERDADAFAAKHLGAMKDGL